MRASLGLDCELSQLEHALLRAHVRRCPECAEFTRELGGLTQEIRATPLVGAPRTRVPARRRSVGTRTLQACAGLAAVVATAAVGSLAGSLSSSPSVQGVKAAHVVRRADPSDAVSRYVAQLRNDGTLESV
jgi:anti-sigma factor RsiW